MFSSQKSVPNKGQKKNITGKESAVTILTSGCHFDGKLYCRGSSRIGGRIEGQVVSEGLLIIEEEAVITATIRADEAIIQGAVKGKLEAMGRVELTQSSRFEGDIITPTLVINEGAKFNGRSFMNINEDSKKSSEPVPEMSFNEDNRENQPEVSVLRVNK